MTTTVPEEWPDIEGAIRTWLRADTDFQAFFAQRAFFGVPRKTTSSSFPMVCITRIGGGNQSGEAPMDMPMLQLDVYGQKADDVGGGRLQVTRGVQVLRKVLSKMRGETRLDDDTVAWDPRVSTVVFSPLPGDDRPRMMVMAIIPCMKISVEASSGDPLLDVDGEALLDTEGDPLTDVDDEQFMEVI